MFLVSALKNITADNSDNIAINHSLILTSLHPFSHKTDKNMKFFATSFGAGDKSCIMYFWENRKFCCLKAANISCFATVLCVLILQHL